MTPCSSAEGHRRFGGMHFLNIQSGKAKKKGKIVPVLN
jgi:hypothetical protein